MQLIRYTSSTTIHNDEFPLILTTELHVERYSVIRETPCGYWIRTLFTKRWTSKTATRRFAYPTEKEALHNFIRRKQRQKCILRTQIEIASHALAMAKEAYEQLKIQDNGHKG